MKNICEYEKCEKEFEVTWHAQKKYCSTECKGKALRLFRVNLTVSRMEKIAVTE